MLYISIDWIYVPGLSGSRSILLRHGKWDGCVLLSPQWTLLRSWSLVARQVNSYKMSMCSAKKRMKQLTSVTVDLQATIILYRQLSPTRVARSLVSILSQITEDWFKLQESPHREAQLQPSVWNMLPKQQTKWKVSPSTTVTTSSTRTESENSQRSRHLSTINGGNCTMTPT